MFLFKEINILSDGSAWRPLINVNDMTKAIEWAIKSNNSKNKRIARKK